MVVNTRFEEISYILWIFVYPASDYTNSKVWYKLNSVAILFFLFINELEPNFERILLHARNNGEKPFASVEHLKKWLIGNQEDYPKFSNDIFFYFLKKSKIETTK